jgi:hypothetical protein
MKQIEKDLLQEKFLLEKDLKKLYEKQIELADTRKKLIENGSTTRYFKPQINENNNKINLTFDKIKKIQDALIFIKKRELKRKIPKLKPKTFQKKNEKKVDVVKNTIVQIPWHNIKFSKGFIKIAYKNISKDFSFENSRDIFQKINLSYKNDNLKHLEINIANDQITKISNPEIITAFIEVLQLQSYYEVDIKDYQLLYDKVINTNNLTANKRHYNIYKKSAYLNYLFAIHDNTQKILYIPEYIIKNKRIIDKHESYLFPVKKKNIYFLVWESVNFGKATYIFKSSKVNIENDRIKLFEYLASRRMANKRDKLIHSDDQKKKYCLHDRISHEATDYNSWKSHLEIILE